MEHNGLLQLATLVAIRQSGKAHTYLGGVP